jgi:hypothetical protein
MNSLQNYLRNVAVVFFIIIQFYCPAQTGNNNNQLLTTWKLQNMTFSDGKPYLKIEELPNELITFKSDSVWERNRGKDKLEGIWYIDGQGILVIKGMKFNGNQTDLTGRKSFWKIKELNSNHLILIYLEREGNNIIYTYNSYFGD